MSHPAEPAPAPNRLAGERSPYLLQHAHNPVDWYPWGPEALERAKREDRPIFLSIGYAACHWCHVMERESFENETIARLLNENFVCIKVDREERPDLDEIYMTATQLLTGTGGWPMTVFLTPEKEPFFAGTYFPPDDLAGRPGLPTVLRAVIEAFRAERENITQSAREVAEAVRLAASPASAPGEAGRDILNRAVSELRGRFDPDHGGFGGAPKFPPASSLDLLLRHFSRTGEAAWLEMTATTLERMARGGIHDQIGGGFHRYAVDARWVVPHFEKMLYDNALLAPVYADAHRVTGSALFLDAARGILEFVRRELTSQEGAFFSSLDADSEGEEGRFYVWTPEEIERALGEKDARLFEAYYDVSPAGNFEADRSVLHAPHPADAVAQRLGMTGAELESRLLPMRARLLEARSRRARPGLDDKVLTAWNGLMISAYARAFAVTADPRDLESASRAADFVLAHLRENGRLLRSWRAGRAGGSAFLEDYAFFIEGLLDLFSMTGEARRLDEANGLARGMLDLFGDPAGGALFVTPRDHEELPARPKSLQDGATPSGNSVAAMDLARLGRVLDDAEFTKRAREIIESSHELLERAPSAFPRLLSALDFLLATPREIVIAGRAGAERSALRAVVNRFYLPETLVVEFDAEDEEGRALAVKMPLLAGKTNGGGATAYVCENSACRKPVSAPDELERMLREDEARGGS